VTSVVRLPYGYLPGANHDPDAVPQNSNGTSITVQRPF
jgi:hypothetical protein